MENMVWAGNPTKSKTGLWVLAKGVI